MATSAPEINPEQIRSRKIRIRLVSNVAFDANTINAIIVGSGSKFGLINEY